LRDMDIKKEHKSLLLSLGLREEDFRRFDGKNVRYEYDAEKGVRLYDPYYQTSYEEYIGVDGWSAWSTEKDTFMQSIRKGLEEARSKTAIPAEQYQKQVTEALEKKFGGKAGEDS